jgi:hypothetical protein
MIYEVQSHRPCTRDHSIFLRNSCKGRNTLRRVKFKASDSDKSIESFLPKWEFLSDTALHLSRAHAMYEQNDKYTTADSGSLLGPER